MSPNYDPDRFRRKWNEMEDPESASAEGLRLCDDILRGRLDPVTHLDLVEAGVEPAWDGPLGDPHIVHEALMKVEIRAYEAERRFHLGAAEQVRLRARVQKLLARSWHRKRNPKQATLIAYGFIRALEELVGGRKALLEVVGRPTRSAAGEATVEVLGIYIASLRRAEADAERGFSSTVSAELYKIAFDLVTAYLGPDLSPRVIYPGTDALAAQWFYRLVHDSSVPDHVVRVFYDLDRQTRPTEKRSEVTAHARDAEYAARLGNRVGAEAEARTFVAAMELLGMVRHLATVREQRYFAA